MAGGKTIPSQKRKPPHEIGMKVNEVARGKGEEYQSGPSGRNKPVKGLGPEIKAGKQPHVPMRQHSGKESPIGKVRPTQSGGPGVKQPNKDTMPVDHFPVQGNDYKSKNKHGHEPGKGSTNRFDLYSAARSGDVRFPKD